MIAEHIGESDHLSIFL